MTAPIALQLYTLRDSLAQDFTGVIKKVAALGYVGVETAGNYGSSPQTGARLFKDLGLQVCSAHFPLPLGDNQTEVLDTAAVLGCNRIVVSGTPRDLKTVEQAKRFCDSCNEANQVAQAHGLFLGIHNHWWEFDRLEDGRTVFQAMQDLLAPTVIFELDVYWTQTGGASPAKLVSELGRRASLLHIKDGPCVVGQPMTAVGEGVVDIPAVIEAGNGTTDWLIVELDECATDMLEAVQKSYQYLVGKGLARGNQN
jgi:sugar phosphate isomerase/epimerase